MTWVSLAEQGKEGATKKSMVDGVKHIFKATVCSKSWNFSMEFTLLWTESLSPLKIHVCLIPAHQCDGLQGETLMG